FSYDLICQFFNPFLKKIFTDYAFGWFFWLDFQISEFISEQVGGVYFNLFSRVEKECYQIPENPSPFFVAESGKQVSIVPAKTVVANRSLLQDFNCFVYDFHCSNLSKKLWTITMQWEAR